MVNGNHNENVCSQICKLFKITDQTSVATEADKRFTIKWEMGILPKP